MSRNWKQFYTVDEEVAALCKESTDDGWTVHSIVPLDAKMDGTLNDQAILIVLWRDEEPGQPFGQPAKMPMREGT